MADKRNTNDETDSFRSVISFGLLLIILIALGAALGALVGWRIGRWIVGE